MRAANVFLVEMENGKINTFRLRDRWLLSKKNVLGKFLGKDAVGHAACKGRIACGNPSGKGKYGISKTSEIKNNPKLLVETITKEFQNKIGYLPKSNSSINRLLNEIKDTY